MGTKKNNYLEINKLTYSEYLRTNHWRTTRKRFWNSKLHRKKCYACKEKGQLDVHHKSYKRLGREKLNDFILLCRECHSLAHRLERTYIGNRYRLWVVAKRIRKAVQKTGKKKAYARFERNIKNYPHKKLGFKQQDTGGNNEAKESLLGS
ncbi:hypothetical protein LCGC14_0660110 [marine sediment metagenome]|uniref:HNH nuclease domain-containing protein n=1 Tax=marine sediment metagenome TaxID=412755 RepID=A0A0F9U203_9ZZZZ